MYILPFTPSSLTVKVAEETKLGASAALLERFKALRDGFHV